MKKFLNEKKKRVLALALACTFLCGFAFAGCDNGSSSDTGNNGNGGFSDPPFVNPGDNLGGGGTGTLPEEIDYSEAEKSVIAAGDVDLSSLKENTDDSAASALAEDGVIAAAGDYILSGEYENGVTISDDVKKGSEIHLFLNGATISSASASAIAKSANKIALYITAVNGTENFVTSTTDGANALQVKGDLYINGAGTLNITASGADASAVKASKACYIADAVVNLSSKKHGVSAETIAVVGATINVKEAAKDGLHAECDFDNKKGETYDFTLESGFVSLQNVSYACKTEGDGIQADTFVYFDGGEYTIETAGGTGSDEGFVSYSAANMEAYGLEADDFRYIKSGGSYKKVADDYNGNISSRYALKQSSKGVKAGEIDYDTDGDDEDDTTITENTLYSILVQSGEFVFDCADDAVHCNGGNLYVNGGTLTIDTLDDGLTSDLLTEVKGGNVNVKSSYEGIEGAYVNISGGEIRVNSSDDGINAAGDDTPIKEYISVSGGSVTVYAEGDGLDSNGSILMTGGTVIVHGPTSGADGALDADSGIIVQGGTLYAAGSLGMVETPSTNSTQYVLSYAQSGAIAAGTALSIQNADGEEIFSVTAEKNCQSVIVSLPAFASGETYKIYADGSLLTSFAISGIITSVGTSDGAGGGDFRPGGVGGAGENRPGGGR